MLYCGRELGVGIHVDRRKHGRGIQHAVSDPFRVQEFLPTVSPRRSRKFTQNSFTTRKARDNSPVLDKLSIGELARRGLFPELGRVHKIRSGMQDTNDHILIDLSHTGNLELLRSHVARARHVAEKCAHKRT